MERHRITRRQFITHTAGMGASLSLSGFLSSCGGGGGGDGGSSSPSPSPLDGVRIVDPHAHPDQFFWDNPPAASVDSTSTLEAIKGLGMVASSFAAVGDGDMYPSLSFYDSAKYQLSKVQGLVASGKVKPVLKTSNVPLNLSSGNVPGAILSIEGGDPLNGNPDRVDEFYGLGIRIITLVHNRNNELGDSSRQVPTNGGLTPAGRQVIARMQDLGMVVDLAHADSVTLQGAVQVTQKPLIDSHTSLKPTNDPAVLPRLRTWEDMERIAATGGVVCTWPLAYNEGGVVRNSFLGWATEIRDMKARIGMAHIGVGTDGGGNLPNLVGGYRDVRDLVSLAAAMLEIGLTKADIEAFFGGNFLRVFNECVG